MATSRNKDRDAMYYQIPLKITKQEDSLWRIEAPSLPGCFVDASTLADALYQVHEVVAMFLDLNQEEGRPLPEEITANETGPLYATVPVAPDEIDFYKVLPKGERVPASSAAKEKPQRGKRKHGR